VGSKPGYKKFWLMDFWLPRVPLDEFDARCAYLALFLDVIMPGMGGFHTCVKLHESAPNRRTPIVFVTSQDDPISRAEAVASGGCGLIPKPVLPCEIMLLALTHTVRSRLEHRMDAPGRQTEVSLESECVLSG